MDNFEKMLAKEVDRINIEREKDPEYRTYYDGFLDGLQNAGIFYKQTR